MSNCHVSRLQHPGLREVRRAFTSILKTLTSATQVQTSGAANAGRHHASSACDSAAASTLPRCRDGGFSGPEAENRLPKNLTSMPQTHLHRVGRSAGADLSPLSSPEHRQTAHEAAVHGGRSANRKVPGTPERLVRAKSPENLHLGSPASTRRQCTSNPFRAQTGRDPSRSARCKAFPHARMLVPDVSPPSPVHTPFAPENPPTHPVSTHLKLAKSLILKDNSAPKGIEEHKGSELP